MAATATAKRKPKAKHPLDQAAKDGLLRQLLTGVEGNAEKLRAAGEAGMTDADLKTLIAECLSDSGGISNPSLGSACCKNTYGTPVWFGTIVPPTRVPDLSGDKLLFAVRRVFNIESQPRKTSAEVQASFSTPRNGKAALSNSNGHANGMGNGQLLSQPAALPAAGRLTIVEEVEIKLEAIQPSPENPREDYDRAFLEQLGQSILDHGLLTPLLVRHQGLDGKYEIIDGETRWRAAKLKKIEGLRCSVVECTDAEAALTRVLSYRQRRDLNPLEEARGLQLLLQKYGCSQRELEAKIGISQGQISNLTRLLKLPKQWQQRVITREITGTQARELAAWNDEPAVAAALDKTWKRNKDRNFDDLLVGALHDVSRELDGYLWDAGGNWKLDVSDPAVKAELRIRKFKTRWDRDDERAFNVKLAEQLKAEAIAQLKAKASRKAERAEASAKSAPTAAEKRKRQQQLAEQLNKKLYRYKVAWLQQRILDRLQDFHYSVPIDFLIKWTLWFAGQHEQAGKREDEIEAIVGKGLKNLFAAADMDSSIASSPLRKILVSWCAHSFEGWRTDFPPATVEAFAENWGIDLAKEWRLDEAFLELFTKDGLIELVGEWKLGMYFATGPAIEARKRTEIIKTILDLQQASKSGVKPPKCLLKVKKVSLS